MSKEKIKYRNSIDSGCYDCTNCLYQGEGNYVCQTTRATVIEEFEPTEDFYKCHGREFERDDG